MSQSYPIKLESDDNETLLVTCPALPEVTTFGEDEAEAINHARDAIEEAIAARMADGREVPEPRGKRGVLVALPMQTSLKVELYRLLKRENITRAELMRRLNWKRESVDRLFRLDHATRLEQFDAAFRALGRQVEISIKLRKQAALHRHIYLVKASDLAELWVRTTETNSPHLRLGFVSSNSRGRTPSPFPPPPE